MLGGLKLTVLLEYIKIAMNVQVEYLNIDTSRYKCLYRYYRYIVATLN